MSGATGWLVLSASIVLMILGADIDRQTRYQTIALQHIATQAKEQSGKLDGIREDNREVLEHLASAAKRGTVCRGLGDASPTDGYMPWCKPAHVEAKRGTAK